MMWWDDGISEELTAWRWKQQSPPKCWYPTISWLVSLLSHIYSAKCQSLLCLPWFHC